MTQITVAYVNPPKGELSFGTIKGTDGLYYNVVESSLDRYEKGMTFDAPVKVTVKGKYTNRWLPDDFDPSDSGEDQAEQQPAPTARRTTAPPARRTPPARTTAPKDDFPQSDNVGQQGMTGAARKMGIPAGNTDRSIFITAIVGRAMGSGQFEPEAIDGLAAAAAAAYDVHLAPSDAPF